MSTNKIEIELNNQNKEFLEVLSKNENQRIIVSAPFGMGKTTFMKQFFEKKKKQFEYFHLYPVNYQNHHNEDIFDLLKYDILLQVISRNPEILKDQKFKGLVSKIGKYFINEGLSGLFNVARSIPLLGETFEFFNQLKTVYDNIEDTKTEESEKLTKINDFLEEVGDKKSENDIITEFIKESLKTIEGKKTILVIDDLDRLDPEHIFRILNILSSHFDCALEDENKFGFNKIILVCDLDNIHNIFSSKYGQNVDFSGYIDKFYNENVFYFEQDNAKLIKYIEDVYIENIKNKVTNNSSQKELQFLNYFLKFLSELGYLNLRQIQLISGVDFQISQTARDIILDKLIDKNKHNTTMYNAELILTILHFLQITLILKPDKNWFKQLISRYQSRSSLVGKYELISEKTLRMNMSWEEILVVMEKYITSSESTKPHAKIQSKIEVVGI